MKRIKIVLFLALISSLLVFAGCNSASTDGPSATNKPEAAAPSTTGAEAITLGTTEGGTYTNAFFGLTAKLPDGWADMSVEDKLKESGIDDISKLSESDEIYGFVFTDDEELADVTCTFAPVDGGDYGISEEYAEYLKGIYSDLYSESSEIGSAKLGGITFSKFSLQDDDDGSLCIADVYCVIRNGYAIEIMSEYYDDEAGDAEAVQSILDSIAFSAGN